MGDDEQPERDTDGRGEANVAVSPICSDMPRPPPMRPAAAIARAMPNTATASGRSPSATPSTTGTPAATTPVTGATIVMLSRDSAAYRPNAPSLPAAPATAPHQTEATDGPSVSTAGTSAANTTSKVGSTHRATRIGAYRRLIRPPT